MKTPSKLPEEIEKPVKRTQEEFLREGFVSSQDQGVINFLEHDQSAAMAQACGEKISESWKAIEKNAKFWRRLAVIGSAFIMVIFSLKLIVVFLIYQNIK